MILFHSNHFCHTVDGVFEKLFFTFLLLILKKFYKGFQMKHPLFLNSNGKAVKIIKMFFWESGVWYNMSRSVLDGELFKKIFRIQGMIRWQFPKRYFVTLEVAKFWFNLIKKNIDFRVSLSKNLIKGVQKKVCTPWKGVLNECHSFFHSWVGGRVLLKFLAMNGSATQNKKECWTC